MNNPEAASELIAETEPGVDPNQLNPHMGHLDPDQQSDDSREQAQSEDKAEEDQGETPDAPVEANDDKDTDGRGLQSKVAELAFENRQLRRQLEQRQEAAPEGSDEAEPLKTLKDFGYDEQQFNKYLIDEGAKRATIEFRKTQAESSHQTEAQRKADEFAAREDAFEAENPGFKERLHKKELAITQEMANFITDPTSEVGLHVGDYLARNPTEAAKIASLGETAQVREMVKLEDRIAKEVKKAQAEKSKASKAPEPPANPVDGTDPGVSLEPDNPKDADAMSDDEWMRAREKQLEARRKKR